MYRFELALYVAEMEEQLKQTAAFLENEWEQVPRRSEREAQAASVSAAHGDVGDSRLSAQQKQPTRKNSAMATGWERAGRTLTSASASCAAEAARAAAAGMRVEMQRSRTYAYRHVHATLQSGRRNGSRSRVSL
jgi:hypothetical protein